LLYAVSIAIVVTSFAALLLCSIMTHDRITTSLLLFAIFDIVCYKLHLENKYFRIVLSIYIQEPK
jgi:hypothetical protein